MRRRDPLADPEPLIRRVYSYVAYRIGDGPDAEDVTAETIERALRYRDSYDLEKGDPVAWLIGIARRVLFSRAGTQAEAQLEEKMVGSRDDLEESSLRRLDLRDAMRRLSDRDREVLSLRYGADLSAKDIGRLLDLKANAVDVAIHRALERLRTELETPSEPDSEVVFRSLPEAANSRSIGA